MPRALSRGWTGEGGRWAGATFSSLTSYLQWDQEIHWSEAHGLCSVTNVCQAEPRFSTAREARGGQELACKVPLWPGARALPSHCCPRSRSPPRGPTEASQQPLTQVATPRCPEGPGAREEEGTFQNRCSAARDLGTHWGWCMVTASRSSEPSGGHKLAPPVGHTDRDAEGESRPRPRGCSPRPTPGLPCACAVLPCPLAEEQDSLTP